VVLSYSKVCGPADTAARSDNHGCPGQSLRYPGQRHGRAGAHRGGQLHLPRSPLHRRSTVSRKRRRSGAAAKLASRRSPRFMVWQTAPGYCRRSFRGMPAGCTLPPARVNQEGGIGTHLSFVEARARPEAARTGRQDACPTGAAGQVPEMSARVICARGIAGTERFSLLIGRAFSFRKEHGLCLRSSWFSLFSAWNPSGLPWNWPMIPSTPAIGQDEASGERVGASATDSHTDTADEASCGKRIMLACAPRPKSPNPGVDNPAACATVVRSED